MPLTNVDIHVVSKSGGEQIVKTDSDGHYTVELKGAATETSMIFVRGHIALRRVQLSTKQDDSPSRAPRERTVTFRASPIYHWMRNALGWWLGVDLAAVVARWRAENKAKVAKAPKP